MTSVVGAAGRRGNRGVLTIHGPRKWALKRLDNQDIQWKSGSLLILCEQSNIITTICASSGKRWQWNLFAFNITYITERQMLLVCPHMHFSCYHTPLIKLPFTFRYEEGVNQVSEPYQSNLKRGAIFFSDFTHLQRAFSRFSLPLLLNTRRVNFRNTLLSIISFPVYSWNVTLKMKEIKLTSKVEKFN